MPDEMTIEEYKEYLATEKLPARLQGPTRLEVITGINESAPELATKAANARAPRGNKFGAIKTEIDGHKFDSKREGARYVELKAMERTGEIYDLNLHPRYKFIHNGVLIGSYRPDFEYRMTVGDVLVTEDVKAKPTMTRDYRLRKKMMKAFHGIDVKEVY